MKKYVKKKSYFFNSIGLNFLKVYKIELIVDYLLFGGKLLELLA
jgi:hypothetical protein